MMMYVASYLDPKWLPETGLIQFDILDWDKIPQPVIAVGRNIPGLDTSRVIPVDEFKFEYPMRLAVVYNWKAKQFLEIRLLN